jgi:hypothetical protein
MTAHWSNKGGLLVLEPMPRRSVRVLTWLAGRHGQLEDLFALNDVEDDCLTFFEAFVTILLNRAEMDEHVFATIAPKKTIPLQIVKPLDCAFVLSHRVHLFVEPLDIGRLIVQTWDACG